MCNYGRRNVFCRECNVVSDECDEPTSCIVQPVGAHGGEVMYFCSVCFSGDLGFLTCDDICICVVKMQFELLKFILSPFMLICGNMIFL